jgi:hypothetical protein
MIRPLAENGAGNGPPQEQPTKQTFYEERIEVGKTILNGCFQLQHCIITYFN